MKNLLYRHRGIVHGGGGVPPGCGDSTTIYA
jgi:hypothetical protein